MRARPRARNVAVQLALKELAHERRRLPASTLARNRVADQRSLKTGGQFRREIAGLVGVRKQHQIGLVLRIRAFERGGVAVGGVVLQQRVLDRINAVDLLVRRLSCARAPMPCPISAASTFAPPSCCAAARASQDMRCTRAAVVFEDREKLHRMRASNFNFSTSFAAAALGSPSKICACLAFCGA